MARPNWSRIREEYLYGYKGKDGVMTFPTYQELADKYKLTRRSIELHAKDEQWQQLKKDAQDSISEQVRIKKEAEHVDERVKEDNEIIAINRLARKQILGAMYTTDKKTGKQVYKQLTPDGAKKVVEALKVSQEITLRSRTGNTGETAFDGLMKSLDRMTQAVMTQYPNPDELGNLEDFIETEETE